MEIPNNLSLVPPAVIPHGGTCSLDNLGQLYKLALLMQTICDKEEGIGLSAVQIGVNYQFYIINYDKVLNSGYGFRVFINCNYKKLGNNFCSLEGCLSLRNRDGSLRHFLVERSKKIIVSGKELICAGSELSVKDVLFECEELEAVVHAHEIDHQFGILISDIGKEYAIWK